MCVCVCMRVSESVCMFCVCLSAIGGMSTWPVNHRTRRAAQRAKTLSSRFGSQIVIPLISSLVSANTLKRQTHPLQHVPVSVCVCLSVVCPSAIQATVSGRLCKLKYNVRVFALIVALPWLWGQRHSNIVKQWSHEWGRISLQTSTWPPF